jgi:hypothetical protein
MRAIKAKGVRRDFGQDDLTKNTGRVFREQQLIAPNDRYLYNASAERERRFQRVRHPLAERWVNHTRDDQPVNHDFYCMFLLLIQPISSLRSKCRH